MTHPRPHSIDCSHAVEPSLTLQFFKDECDINRIMAKFDKTGLIDFAKDINSGRFADLASAPDYHSAMNIVASAQEAFDTLPAKIRDEFSNDPAEFLAFVSKPENSDRAKELGLTVPPPSPSPVQTFSEAVQSFKDAISSSATPKSPTSP